MTIFEERLAPPHECLDLLETFGCDVEAIVSLRQCAWIASKLARVPLDWSLDIAVALRLAWPVISERLNEVPAGERFAWAREQPKVKADLGDFFPAKPPRGRRKTPRQAGQSTTADNVVSLDRWRRDKQRADNPLTAA